MANQEKFFVEYGVDTDSTTSFKVPAGTTAQRDASPESGLFRYNTSNNQFEGYSNGSWGEIGGSSLGQSFDVDTFTGDNSTTAFTLGRSVSSEDYLIVFIDGVFQAQDAYTLSGTTLTLDSPPETGSSIIAYSVVPISVAEIPADTDDLTEGSTNLYFTNARVDSRLSSGSVATIETSGNVTVGGDLSVSGGLTVSGTTTTVNSTTTSVTDSMIELANSNTTSDVIDIGIYGNYDDGLSEGGVSEYTGLFRDASDSTWKLFDGLEEEPTTTVNTAGTNYAKAALEVGDLDATTLTVDTDTLFVDATNDRVGIGTSSPSSPLDVRGGNIYVDGGGSGGASQVILTTSASSGANFGQISNTGTRWSLGYGGSIGTVGTEVLTWNSSRNVGIGTSSPTTYSLNGTHLDVSSASASQYTFIHANTPSVKAFFASNDSSGLTALFTYSNHPLTFGTNNTERMRIHSGGQITASYQPCFMCYPTSSFTASGGSVKYTFASEAFDNQNEYNTSTGRFTAPIAGKYIFMAELALQSSTSALGYAGIGVRVNGSGDVYFGGWGHKSDGVNNTSSAQYAKTNSTVILNLAQGDYIELYIELSGSHTVLGGNGGAYTRLMGHLLTA